MKDITSKDIIDLINTRMSNSKIKITKMAKDTGSDYRRILGVLKGRKDCTIPELITMANYLNITLFKLIELTEARRVQ